MTAKSDARQQMAMGQQMYMAAPMMGGGKGMGANFAYGMVNSLDPGAHALLESLPRPVQNEILGRLQQQSGVKNPSAWVVKACMEAGATPQQANSRPQPAMGGRGPMAAGAVIGGGWAQPGMRRPPAPPAPMGRNRLVSSLDGGAQELLHSLPAHTQQELPPV